MLGYLKANKVSRAMWPPSSSLPFCAPSDLRHRPQVWSRRWWDGVSVVSVQICLETELWRIPGVYVSQPGFGGPSSAQPSLWLLVGAEKSGWFCSVLPPRWGDGHIPGALLPSSPLPSERHPLAFLLLLFNFRKQVSGSLCLKRFCW